MTTAEQIAQSLQSDLKDALKEAAKSAVSHELLDGTSAIAQYGITRAALKKISQTQIHGRRKPLYQRKSIHSYINKQTHN